MKKYLFVLPLLMLLGLVACNERTGCPECGIYVSEDYSEWSFEMREDSTWTIIYPAEHKRTVEHGAWERRTDELVRLTRSDNKKVFRDIQWDNGKWGFEEYGWFTKQ